MKKILSSLFIVITALFCLLLGCRIYMSTAQAHFRTLVMKPIPSSVTDLQIIETGLGQDYSCSFTFRASPSDIDLIKRSCFPVNGMSYTDEAAFREIWSRVFQKLGEPLPPSSNNVSFQSILSENTRRTMLVDKRTEKVYMTYWEGY